MGVWYRPVNLNILNIYRLICYLIATGFSLEVFNIMQGEAYTFSYEKLQ